MTTPLEAMIEDAKIGQARQRTIEHLGDPKRKLNGKERNRQAARKGALIYHDGYAIRFTDRGQAHVRRLRSSGLTLNEVADWYGMPLGVLQQAAKTDKKLKEALQ